MTARSLTATIFCRASDATSPTCSRRLIDSDSSLAVCPNIPCKRGNGGGMEAVLEKLVTAEEFSKMPDPLDGSRQELEKGVVCTMPPAMGIHGIVCSKADRLIGNYSDANKLGHVASNDTGVIVERNPDTVRGPDVAFWSF